MDPTVYSRIKKVLDTFSEPYYIPRNEAHLNSLLNYLTKELDDVPFLCRDKIHKILLAWLQKTIMKWQNINETPSLEVLRFVLNILMWVCQTEETHNVLNRDDFTRLFSILLEKGGFLLKEIGDVFEELLSSMMDCELGSQLILKSKYWEIFLKSKMYCRVQNMSTVSCMFIAKLIKKTFFFDSLSCQMIVHAMLKPLQLDAVDFAFDESLSSSLHLIIQVLDELLKHQINTDNKDLFKIFTSQHDLEKYIRELLKANGNDYFLHDLYRILIVLSFSKMYVNLSHKKVICYGEKDFPMEIFEIIGDIATNVCINDGFKLLYASLIYCKIVGTKIPLWQNSKSKEVSLEFQLVYLLAYAGSVYILEEFYQVVSDLWTADTFRLHYASMSCEYVFSDLWKFYHKWKQTSRRNTSLSQGIIALKHLSNYVQQCSPVQAKNIFVLLIYNVKDINQIIELKENLVAAILNQPEYITLLLQCIAKLIDYFSISWNDCVEAPNILDHIYVFLSYLEWPADIIVNGLQLVDKAISKCMNDQMALLFEGSENYSLKPYGTMLRANLKKSEWKIRECSVSLLGTISAYAITKYPSFKNLISEHEFPYLVLEAAIVDESPFVRTAALKCLQEMIQIKEIWNILFMKYNIMRYILNILITDRDGMVRSEATILLSLAYQHQRIPENILGVSYGVMRHIALVDSDKRVRMKSLHFWKSGIDELLTEAGMIDGTFPGKIFSKKLHKIVTLTSERVKKIVVEILHQLAANGCLSVFHAALNEIPSSELRISEYAKNVIDDFVTLLRRYKITPADVGSTFAISASAFNDSHIYDFEIGTITPTSSSVNHRDMNSSVIEGSVDSKQLKYLTPAEFVEFIYAKFDNDLNKRKKWDDFNALLYEILSENNQHSNIEMTCP